MKLNLKCFLGKALFPLAGVLAFECIARAATVAECNEKTRVQIVKAAKEKCAGKYEDLFWSEKELDISSDGKEFSAAFLFKCSVGKRYIGLIKSSLPPNCEISKTEVAHASRVPIQPLIR